MPELIIWKKRQLDRMRRDMHQLFDRMMGEFSPVTLTGIMKRCPAIELSEMDDSLILRADIPGVNPDSLEIDLADNLLKIKGEIKKENIRKDEECHGIERSYDTFSRSIQLPCRVVREKVRATCKNGVLNIVMPKSRPEEHKKIRVEFE